MNPSADPLFTVGGGSNLAELPYLLPVVEAPWYEGSPRWPWRIADRQPFSFFALTQQMSDADVGSLFAQLVNYDDLDSDISPDIISARILEADTLSIPGGIQAVGPAGMIPPSCCCGLEDWRAWREFLQSGESPWLGHDPFPWIELSDGIVRVWSDGAYQPAPSAFSIDFEQTHFLNELGRVEQELRATLRHIELWLTATGFPHPVEICRKIDSCFGITAPKPRR